MSDLNELIVIPEEPKRRERKKRTWTKSVMTAALGGLVGSVLTMGVLLAE